MDTASSWIYEYYLPSHWYSAAFPIEQVLCDYFISFTAADFLTSVDPADGKTVTCVDNSSFDAKTIAWDFGDNSGNTKLGSEVTPTLIWIQLEHLLLQWKLKQR